MCSLRSSRERGKKIQLLEGSVLCIAVFVAGRREPGAYQAALNLVNVEQTKL